MVRRFLRPGFKWAKRTIQPRWVQTRDKLCQAEYEMILRNSMNYAANCKLGGIISNLAFLGATLSSLLLRMRNGLG